MKGALPMKILREERGSVLILTALSMTMLLSFLALAIDIGNLYYRQRQLQTLADSAAMAGALEASACSGTKNCTVMQTAATTALTEGGGPAPTLFLQCAAASGSGLLLTVNNGPCALSGDPNSGNANYVEAVVSEQVPTFFARIFGVNTLQISARAEAGYATASSSSSAPCLNTNDLQLNSGAIITDASGSTCGINDNYGDGNALSLNSGVTVNVGSFTFHGTTSNINKNCGSCSTYTPYPTTSTPIVPDPYKSLTAPSQPATSTTNTSVISGNTALQPGYYSNTINFNSGIYTVTLSPGLYYFGGGFNIDSNVTITGSGVTLFFPSGSNVNINSAATWDLTAPSSALSDCASCAGMLIWEPSGSLNLDSASGSSFGGAVYLPNGTLQLNSSSGVTAYGMIYANEVSVDSGASISLSGSSGGGPANGSTTISLAE
jgi:Flp pilus assembly protein TadG